MEGLEAIKDRIISIAGEKASDIEFACDKTVAEILDEARGVAEDILKESDKRVKSEISGIMRRYESSANSERRKIMLSAKQDILENALDDAVLKLKGMPAEKKKKLYGDMLDKVESNCDSPEIQFNEDDLEIAKALSDELQGEFKIDPNPGKFSGGFIVRDGNIETNMTFEMILRQHRQELVAVAAEELFSGEDK